MSGFWAIYLRQLLLLRRRFWRLLASMSVAPFLYLVTFGFGMGAEARVGGMSYSVYLLPGLVALSSMTQAFAIAGEINIARFYHRMFEEFLSAPVRRSAIVAGEVLAGVTRACLSASVIVLLAFCFGVRLSLGPALVFGVVLNGFVFASLAVASAMLIRSHQDQFLFTNFIITPMAFLGGTFFPVERMPALVRPLLEALPVTHAARIIRAAALGGEVGAGSWLALALAGALAFGLALWSVDKAKE